jgi:Domain of unknown function (DUF4383)
MQGSSPARLYATLIGGTLVIVGIIGFFYNAHFGSGSDVFGNDRSVDVFGILSVNGWHNLFHIATGALGLLAAGYAARTYALGFGLLYVVLAIYGFIIGSGDNLLGIIPINTEDNFLHLMLGLLGLAAGAATSTPTTSSPPAAASSG